MRRVEKPLVRSFRFFEYPDVSGANLVFIEQLEGWDEVVLKCTPDLLIELINERQYFRGL